jgi:hypothetical protein
MLPVLAFGFMYLLIFFLEHRKNEISCKGKERIQVLYKRFGHRGLKFHSPNGDVSNKTGDFIVVIIMFQAHVLF